MISHFHTTAVGIVFACDALPLIVWAFVKVQDL